MRLLFVCARNRLRSPTAERVFAAVPGVEVESAGVAPDADNPVTPELLAWADVILVMEPAHRAKLSRRFGAHLRGKRVVSLGIADDYDYMAPELVRLLWERVPRLVPALAGRAPDTNPRGERRTMASPALFFDTLSGFQRTEALRAAIELDLFTHIEGGSRTALELAEDCGAAERGVRVLADYLTTLGFLTKAGERYALTPDSTAFLTRQSPNYLGGVTEFLLDPSMRACFAHLTDAVRKGGTAASAEGTVSHDNPIWVAFARAMAPMMALPAKLLAELVGGEPNRPLRVLDVAAGHGLFGIEIAKRFPQSHVTALDWPNVLAVAAENAQRAGVEARHALLPGSAFDTDWGGPYDVVLLTNFLHHFDLPTCEQLARRARGALADGGRALTLEFVPNPDRVTPPATAGFALTMLATTARGDAYTFAEYEGVFTRAGFARSEFVPLPPSTQQAVISYKS